MSTAEFPPAALIEAALRAATRAPSPHNTQPWRFDVAGDRIDLWLDRDRVLPIADPDGREARLSCGAALLNLRLALRAAGRMVLVDLLPDRARPDLLATVWIKGERRPDEADRALAAVIDRRASNRRPFLDRPVPPAAKHALVAAAAAEGAQLILLEASGTLSALVELLRRADRLQEEDPAFQAEVRAWTAEPAGRDDGVPASAGGPRPAGGAVLAMRRYGESTVERPFEADPLLAVLSTRVDTALDQVGAGRAMQRVLLVATTLGLSASFLSQPVELPDTRAALRALIGGRDHPQAVLRLGYGHPVVTTPRRAVAAVTTSTVDKGQDRCLWKFTPGYGRELPKTTIMAYPSSTVEPGHRTSR